MQINVSGLRILITAGAQGIGYATAQAFVESGGQVHICDIDQSRLNHAIANLPQISGSLTDVADHRQVDNCIEEAILTLGGIDVLINNAGISGPAGAVEEMEPEGWQQTLDVNLNSQFYFARRVIPLMKAQRRGSIINISSTAGLYGYPWRSPYVASKWAIIGLTKSWAMELGEHGIRVNAICPGSLNNPRMDHVIAIEAAARGISEHEVRSGYEKQVSLQTFIDPDEIANMILFVCSPLGSKISGQALSVDGHTETLRT